MTFTIRIPNRPDDEPVCADCRHYRHTGSVATQCVREECSVPDRITGRHSVTPEDARNKGYCGSSGKFFAAKPPPSWLDRNIKNVFVGIIVLGFLGYMLKISGVIG
jgi:hypothetical protein